VADIALDADGLRRDRQRYAGLLEQAEQQIAAWNERADHLQQAIDGLDHLLALAGDDPARDGGVPRRPVPGRGAPSPAAAGGTPERAPEAAAPAPGPSRKAAVAKKPAKAKKAPTAKPPPPLATPAAPEPVGPPATAEAEVPKGTDALRLVFEGEPDRAWSLAELIDALGARGWLPTSRRPEEGARISLKRLAERGRAVRTEDGRWRLAPPGQDAVEPAPEPGRGPTWPSAEPPTADDEPAAEVAPASRAALVPPPPPSASFGRPVGGTVTEL
jgi:hypothetical protein